MNNRLKEIRKVLHKTQTAFGEAIGATRPMIAAYEGGKVSIPEPIIRLICREFNVDYAWLTDGIGEMFVNTDDEVLAALDDLMTGEHENTRALIRTLAKMNEAELDMVDRFIEQFKKELGL